MSAAHRIAPARIWMGTALSLLGSSPSLAQDLGDCTAANITQEASQRIRPNTNIGIVSQVIGCRPAASPAPSPNTSGETVSTWSVIDGGYRKQIAVTFDALGGSVRAGYQQIPLVIGKASDDDTSKRDAAALAILALGLAAGATGAGGAAETVAGTAVACTPATINAAAPQAIQPHMFPPAVSAILGCPPTDITIAELGTVWIWSVPDAVAISMGFEYMRVGVAFDIAGAVYATYTTAPLVTTLPVGTGALRVDPGGWVPGAYAAP